MDTFVFMVTVHGEGGHVATYEVHAGCATDAIGMAANAYRDLVLGTVRVCEVNLKSSFVGKVVSVEKEQADPPEPDYPEQFKNVYRTARMRARILPEILRAINSGQTYGEVGEEYGLSVETLIELDRMAGGDPPMVKSRGDELPGYTWAQQHGFSVEAWRLFGRLVGSAYINGNSFIDMSKWLGYAGDDEFETIIDRMTDYESRILFGVVEG